MSKKRAICFIIMPFSKTTTIHTEEYWTAHYKDFLKPLIEDSANLRAKRAEPLRGDILKEIICALTVSPIIVADLTDCNPNVYWELGVRQSFKHGTITIAEAGTKLPFDIGGKGTLFYYPNNHLKMEQFRTRFQQAIKDCLLNPNRPDSYVLDAIEGRGTLFEIFCREEAIRRLAALISECDRNLDIMDLVYAQCEENKSGKQAAFRTERLRISAIELLVTNRYIDEVDSFFLSAEQCFDDINAINNQLSLWEHITESTEKWFLERLKKKTNKLEKFRDVVNRIIVKIKSRI